METILKRFGLVNSKFSDKLLIHTEGCTGYSKFNKSEEIQNGEIYGHDIIGDLNAGANRIHRLEYCFRL